MEYHNNVENGFSVKIDEEGNFSGIVRNCESYKAGKEFSGNVHSLTMQEECIIDGILTECFDMRTSEGKAVYEALLNAEEVAEEATEEPKEHEEDETEDRTDGEEPMKPTFYNSIYEYTKNADLSYYEIADGTIRETPFIEEIKPAEDPDFVIFSKGTKYDGDWYTEVNFGEEGKSWLLDSELYETVFIVYTEESPWHYVTDGRVYETEDEAKASIF